MIGLLPHLFAQAAEQPQGIAALGLDPLGILAQAVTFLVLFILIKKFALDKIVNTLETRRKTIDDGVLLGLEMEKEKSELADKIEAMLQEARKEADKIIAGGQHEAGAIIKAAEDAAKRKADALLADAHHQIGEDIEKAKNELKRDIIGLVAETTGAVIQEKVDAKKDAALIERLLKGAK